MEEMQALESKLQQEKVQEIKEDDYTDSEEGDLTHIWWSIFRNLWLY